MNKEEFITERTRIMSEMLDNPDDNGIYRTGLCFEQLDDLFDKISIDRKEKADKWDKLDKEITKFYFDEDGNIIEDGDNGLISIGEAAATAMGYL